MAIGKITSKSLAADAVTSANLAPGAVTISDIPDSEITADKLHTTLDLSTKTLTLTQASVTAHESALTVTQSQISDLSTTSDLTEGSNLYYTDARADARIAAATTSDLTEGTNLYYTDARADARAQLKIDALVGAAPGTLDTLEELGDALGDDPNFATTVTNSIATKLPLAGGTLTGTLTVNAAFVNNVTSGRAGYFASDNPNGTNNHIAIFRDNETQNNSGDGLGTIAITSAPGQDVYFGKRFKDSNDNTFAVMQNSSGGELFTLNLSTGNLGLGTDAPAHKLHVKTPSNALSEPLALFENDTGGGGDVSIRLEGGASGNADEIYIEFNDRADPTNSFAVGMDDDASKLFFGYGALGTMNGHTQMTLNSDGNLGLGTDSSASTDTGNITIKGGSTLNFSTHQQNIASNATFDTTWKYISNGFANRFRSSSGQYVFDTAPSGTAGNNITFRDSVTIGQDGELTLKPTGITTGLRLQGRSSDNNFYIQFKSNDGNSTHSAIGTESATNGLLYNSDIHRFNSTSSAAEYMRIKSNGNVGIGVNSPDAKLHVNGAAIIGSSNNIGTTPIAGLHILDQTYSTWDSTLSKKQVALRVETYWKGSDNHDRAIGDYGGGIGFNHLGGHSTSHNENVHAWVGLRIEDTPSHERSNLVFATNNNFNDEDAGILERMCITPAGDVGINTKEPKEKLHVDGPSAYGGPKWGTWTETMTTRNGGNQTVRIVEDWSGRWILVGRWAANAATSVTGTWSSVRGLSTSTSQSETSAFSADFGETYPTECRFLGATDFTNYYNTRTIDFIHGVPVGRPWELFMSNGDATGMGQVTGTGSTKYGWTARGAYDGFGRWSNPNYQHHRIADVGGGGMTHSQAAFRTPTNNAFNWNATSDAKVSVDGTGATYSGQDTDVTSMFGSDDAYDNKFGDSWPALTSNSNFSGTQYSSAVWVLIKMGGI